MLPITFTTIDLKVIDLVQDNLAIIIVEITNCVVKETLVDQDSSTDIKCSNSWKSSKRSFYHMMNPRLDSLGKNNHKGVD